MVDRSRGWDTVGRMTMSRYLDVDSPYSRSRIPAPPSASRLDAVFVRAISQLAAFRLPEVVLHTDED